MSEVASVSPGFTGREHIGKLYAGMEAVHGSLQLPLRINPYHDHFDISFEFNKSHVVGDKIASRRFVRLRRTKLTPRRNVADTSKAPNPTNLFGGLGESNRETCLVRSHYIIIESIDHFVCDYFPPVMKVRVGSY